MPTIKENRAWGDPQVWKNYREGDSWSDPWGNPDDQWVWTIFPRIHRYVPTGRILEIAPGFGRWTNYLKELCKELVVVDLNELCIKRCKERFSSSNNIAYYVNDGKTLDMIPDKSIDFAFSFDSLVDVEVNKEELLKDLSELQELGLVKNRIISKQDEPVYTWKTEFTSRPYFNSKTLSECLSRIIRRF